MPNHPIGIDLGTTYSAIAKWVNRTGFTGSEPYNIPLEGRNTLPSKVFIEEDEEGGVDFIVGSQANKEGLRRPDQFIEAVKRMMDEAEHQFDILGRSFSPIDISAEILKSLLGVVEGVEGPGTYVPAGIVVTVPYYFKQHQNLNTHLSGIKAIKDLYAERKYKGKLEDLMLNLLAEPIAAGLDYAFHRDGGDAAEKNLVFDLGGGTFDVTVISLTQEGKKITFEVLGVDGDDRLGGEDFDDRLLQWICDKEGIDFDTLDEKEKKKALRRICPEVTKLKEELSTVKRAEFIVPNAIGARNIDIEVRRKDFEECLTKRIDSKSDDERDYIKVVEEKLDDVILKAGVKESDISWVLMVGGSSKIPVFRQMIVDRFGEKKCRDMAGVNISVTKGAAIYAAYLLDEKLQETGKSREYLQLWDNIEIKEVTAHKLGMENRGQFIEFLRDNMLTPYSKTKVFQPTQVSSEGIAQLDKITIVQGNRDRYDIVGEIELDDIYTHGRRKDDISINIRFTSHRNMVHVEVFVKEGNADKSDYRREGQLSFKEEDTEMVE